MLLSMKLGIKPLPASNSKFRFGFARFPNVYRICYAFQRNSSKALTLFTAAAGKRSGGATLPCGGIPAGEAEPTTDKQRSDGFYHMGINRASR